MKNLFSLGELYVSDFLEPNQSSSANKVSMDLMLDTENGSVRLEKVAPLSTMYGKYWYRSGINNTMKKELSGIVNSITENYQLSDNDLWIDIACNDGTLLGFLPKNLIRVGIDPADDSFKIESEKNSDLIIKENYYGFYIMEKLK